MTPENQEFDSFAKYWEGQAQMAPDEHQRHFAEQMMKACQAASDATSRRREDPMSPDKHSEAVNLARNWLDETPGVGGWDMTKAGIRKLAEAVMANDKNERSPSSAARESTFDRDEVVKELTRLLDSWGNNQIYLDARSTVYKARSLLQYPPSAPSSSIEEVSQEQVDAVMEGWERYCKEVGLPANWRDRLTISLRSAIQRTDIEVVGIFVQRDGKWIEIEDRDMDNEPDACFLYREAHASDSRITDRGKS